METVWAKSLKATGHTTFFVMGDMVFSMSEIPAMFENCLQRGGYLFFADKMTVPVIDLHERVFAKRVDSDMLEELRQRLYDAIVGQNEEQMREAGRSYGRLVLRLSEGKKEDACFYFCTAVRFVEERCSCLELPGAKQEMKELLERSRACQNYGEMEKLFEHEFARYLDAVQAAVVNSDRRDIMKAKEYIDRHYMENLSLNVLAEKILKIM